jgi:AcrR family transcriptional regulator
VETEAVGLRERTRRAVRAELMSVAMDLFLDQGFEQTTVEQIATAAGLSRRSFFRYFATKDEILGETLASTGHAIAAALSGRPLDPVWTAVRRAFDPLLAAIANDERALPMMRMMLHNPALAGSHRDKQTSWQHAIATAAQDRLRGDPHDAQLQATALAGAALACLTAAQSQWSLPENTTTLGSLLDTAMNAVHPLDT